MNYSIEDLKNKLGNIAILEDGHSIDKNGHLSGIKDILDENIKLELFNVYQNNHQLIKISENKIDTLLIETTFIYEYKILEIAKSLIKSINTMDFKPKKIVNTMDYGFEALWYICSKLDMEVYRINYAEDFSMGELSLEKFEITNYIKSIEIKNNYSWIDEFFEK